MKPKIEAMTDMLAAMELSREEQVSLIRHLQEMWGIPGEELMPPSELFKSVTRIEGLCLEVRDLLKLQETSVTVSDSTDDTGENHEASEGKGAGETSIAAAGGKKCKISKQPKFSKNGKRLGRPPKNAQPQPVLSGTDESAATDEGTEKVAASAVSSTEKTDTDEKTEIPAVVTENPENGTAGDPTVLDNTIRLVNAEDVEGAEALKMGKKYDFAIIYKWDSRLYVKSHYVLSGMYPEGVCINYEGNAKPGYTQFAISLADEVPGVLMRQAQAYAANKLPRFEGERWKVMDSIQQGTARKLSADLNRLLNKLSGDLFRGKYASGDRDNVLVPGMKIRYAVDIK